MANSGNLHLPDLAIKGFRGIDELTIRKLGRVTLLAGKNSIGKTTVLDAVRAYAARGDDTVLSALLKDHDEFSAAIDEDGDSFNAPDWPALFHGREIYMDSCVSIGPADNKKSLRIEISSLNSLDKRQASFLRLLYPESSPYDRPHVLKVVFQGHEQVVPWLISENVLESKPISKRKTSSILRMGGSRIFNDNEMPSVIECVTLGPGVPKNDSIANFWDTVALTDDQPLAIKALELILGSGVDGVAVVGDDSRGRRRSGRRAMVKLKNRTHRVPLRSLGDGVTRLFTVALALANSRDGFLLIDEAENGIHHSVQAGYWRMVLQAAQDNNVQVLATTHSWDCVRGFAQAASENEDVEGVLVRLEKDEKDEEGLYTVEYSEKTLHTATKRGSEVR